MNALLLCAFVVGLAVADYGIWLVHRPAALVFAGLSLALGTARIALAREGA